MIEDADTQLWNKIISTERPSKDVVIEIKGIEVEVKVVALTDTENEQVITQAETRAKKALKDAKKDESIGYVALYRTMVASETIFQAIRNPHNVNKRFFPTAQSIRDVMSVSEVTIAFDRYLDFYLHANKRISQMTSEEVFATVNKLIKEGISSDHFLDLCCSVVLKDLVIGLVSQARISQTSNSSSTEPLENL